MRINLLPYILGATLLALIYTGVSGQVVASIFLGVNVWLLSHSMNLSWRREQALAEDAEGTHQKVMDAIKRKAKSLTGSKPTVRDEKSDAPTGKPKDPNDPWN